MRQIWVHFDKKPHILRKMQAMLPPSHVQVLGCDFIVHPKNNWTEFVMWRDLRLPEHDATETLRRRLEGTDPVIVDVGANAGAFSLPILKTAGPGARALLFEPNPEMVSRLKANIALNRFDNAEVFDCAVSDAPSRSTLFFPANGNLGQARIELAYKNGPPGAHVEVDIRPLPDLLAEQAVTHVDFLKVDVEGLEDRVIAPLLTSGPLPRLIYFEIAHDKNWTHPLTDRLSSSGYTRIAEFGPNALYERG